MTSRTFRPLPLLLPLLVLGAGLSLAACATHGPVAPAAELSRLEADCTARGGVLVQTGRTTGQVAVDNICRISGGPSDRLRPQN